MNYESMEQKIGRIQKELETVNYGDECPLHGENDCADVKKAYDRGYVNGLYEAYEADRPQGEWTDIYQLSTDGRMTAQCKNCREKIIFRDKTPNFCPNCGARMKGESTDIDCFDTCKHAYSEVCDECYKGNKYDAIQTDCKDTSCPYFKNPDYSRCMECKSHTERSRK